MCDYAPDREGAMLVLERDMTGKPTIWCDPCLAPFISTLNTAGLRTIASCCGHDHAPGWVMLADGRTLFVVDDEWAERISDLAHSLVGCKPGFECSGCASEIPSSPGKCCPAHHFEGCTDGGPGCCADCPINPTSAPEADR